MEFFKPFKLGTPSSTHERLTSTEIGKLWAIYLGNTLSQCILSYFLQHVNDPDVKKIVGYANSLSDEFVQNVKYIFKKEGIPLPLGLTSEDVNLGAPRLFADEFYLHYLKYVGKAGLSIYSVAVPLVLRKDVRDFFIYCLNCNMKLLSMANDVMLDKGWLMKPPPIPVPDKIDIVEKQSFFNGYFGNVRTLHALEITHLYDNLENNVVSKALLIGFSQTAKEKKVKEYLLRGKDITNKHVEICSQKLHKDNLPSPPLLDHLVSTSDFPPFSDKLMVQHKVDMFSMKIRSYSNALSLNGRRDLAAMYTKLIADVSLYMEDGSNILIDNGWLEQPPHAANRENS